MRQELVVVPPGELCHIVPVVNDEDCDSTVVVEIGQQFWGQQEVLSTVPSNRGLDQHVEHSPEKKYAINLESFNKERSVSFFLVRHLLA